MRISTVILLTLCLFMGACASGFENNYQPASRTDGGHSPIKYCPSPKVEKLSPTADIEEVKSKMQARGYILIGEAQWESTSDESDTTAREQGQKVGACLVLWRRMDAGVEHTTRSVSTYVPERKKKVKVNGKTTTIKEKAHTEYHSVPVDLQRYDFRGLFFGKLEGGTEGFGIESAAPSSDFMAENDNRRGILVVSVKPHSPAFQANIFPGDVIIQVNGKDVYFGDSLPLAPGHENVLIIDRKGKKYTKKVHAGTNFIQ